MRVTILGSAAAEGMPAMWCRCGVCCEAKKRGGKDLRRRTAYLLDEDTLVDFGPDIFWQINAFGIDLDKIRRIIFTHRHCDHLSPLDLEWRGKDFSCGVEPLAVYGGRSVLNRIVKFLAEEECYSRLDELKITPHLMTHGSSELDSGMRICAFDADHDPGRHPLIYTVERGGCKLLIGNDSGYFPPQTLSGLAGAGIDTAILDCTGAVGGSDWRSGHMGAATVLELREALWDNGALKPDAKVFVNHFSHNGKSLHRDLEDFFTPRGIGVGFDGMTLEV